MHWWSQASSSRASVAGDQAGAPWYSAADAAAAAADAAAAGDAADTEWETASSASSARGGCGLNFSETQTSKHVRWEISKHSAIILCM